MIAFADFFFAVWGREPFQWQRRLAEQVVTQGWPPEIGLPTAAGKTAIIDIAVYALAAGAPGAARRVFFVVDRRVIVDEAARRAATLATKLREAAEGTGLGEIAQRLRELGGAPDPLETAVLRGGIPRDNSWTDSPIQPLVVCSTVDQVGSSLLFRSYGCSNEYGWPVRAGLVGNDALIVLDEAHTSAAFAETLAWVRKYRAWADKPLTAPWTVVEMSATPRGEGAFREDGQDIVQDELLGRRWRASKRARLVLVDAKEEEKATNGDFTAVREALVREAKRLRDESGAKVIGVIANRVASARRVHDELRSEADCEAVLLIGRSRPYDRDRLWNKHVSKIGLDRKSEPDKTVFVVATQSIEVGANLDFDALVTEIASIDALEQRFGRLDRNGRRGESPAAIVAQRDQIKSAYTDPIYGGALSETWKWLDARQQKVKRLVEITGKGKRKPRTRSVKEQFVEMGVLALREALAATENRDKLRMPLRRAPVLLPAHLDLLAQTSPVPAVSPEPALYLHGPGTGSADVQLVWRGDLAEGQEELWPEIVAMCPPSAAEAVSLPVWTVRSWLALRSVDAARRPGETLADLDGANADEGPAEEAIRPVLRWRSGDEAQVLDAASAIQPGMVIVAPATYGGCDEFGWNPSSLEPVEDIGDPVKLLLGRPVLRLHAELARRGNYEALAKELREADTVEQVRETLGRIRDYPGPEWMPGLIRGLADSPNLQLIEWPGAGEEDERGESGGRLAAVSARGGFEQESGRSVFTREVRLEEHLAGTSRWASQFARDLPVEVRETVVKAAEFHDIGKADPRFQAWLRGGLPLRPEELLAKSQKSGLNRQAIRRARERAGYPEGGRHELLSVALLAQDAEAFAGLDAELLLHLVGSHHGRCRPFAPVVADEDSREVSFDRWRASVAHDLHKLDSGVCDRFWALTRRYGWWGLAYLETLVRLADCRQSEREEER